MGPRRMPTNRYKIDQQISDRSNMVGWEVQADSLLKNSVGTIEYLHVKPIKQPKITMNILQQQSQKMTELPRQ